MDTKVYEVYLYELEAAVCIASLKIYNIAAKVVNEERIGEESERRVWGGEKGIELVVQRSVVRRSLVVVVVVLTGRRGP